MNDLDDRLRADGTAWQQLIDGGVHAMTAADEPTERRRWLGPALSAAAVAAIVVTIAVVLGRSGDHHATTGRTQDRGSHTFGRLTVSFPSEWHAVEPTFTTGAGTQPIGYIVSTDPIPQCRPDAGGGTGCGAPIDGLADGASAVVANETIPPDQLNANTEVDGWPARLQLGDALCLDGSTYGSSVEFVVGDFDAIEVLACTESTDPAVHRAIDRILTSLRYSDRSAVTIDGRLVVVGGPAPGSPRPAVGRVVLRDAHGGPGIVVPVDRTGRYSAKVAPGTYVITGRAPAIHALPGDPCRADNPVAATRSVTADVICSIN